MSEGAGEAHWHALLGEMNQLVLDCELRDEVPDDVLERGWLGEPPASDAAIAAAETRLGLKLPPSYKAFLRVANGWHWPHPDVRMMLPVERIERLGVSNNDHVRSWLDGYLEFSRGRQVATRLGIEIAAKLIDSEDPVSNVAAMVEISLEEPPMSEALILLDPTTFSDNDEIEARFSSHWTVGLRPVGTFWEFMKSGRDALARFDQDYL